MQRQARRDTGPELAVRRALHARGWRYFVDRSPLRGVRRKADLVFPGRMVAVYVDGCFWHRCPVHGTVPKSNTAWWIEKLNGNVERDRDTDKQLVSSGWTVVRAWEHEPVEEVVQRVENVLRSVNVSLP